MPRSSRLRPLPKAAEWMGLFARAACWILFALLLPWPSFPGEAAQADTATKQPDLVIVQAPVVQSGALSDRFPQGSRLVRLAPRGDAPIVLTQDFFAAADPRVSFDGVRVLFAGKKSPDEHWQIWEMNINGSDRRQITRCADDCMKPAYLPRGEIVFTARPTRAKGADSQLWACKVDGSDSHPITFGPGDFEVETVLANGAILATARSPLLPANGQPADRELYTLRPDGSGLATLRCDHEHPALRSQAAELDDGSVVFVKSPLRGGNLSGELAWIRRGAPHNASLTPPEIQVSSPMPLSDEKLAVARELNAASSSAKTLALYDFDATERKFGALIYQDPKLASVAAVPVAAHVAPRWYWSTLNPALHAGYFVCLDSYKAQGAPHGRLAVPLAKVRVWRLDSEASPRLRRGAVPAAENCRGAPCGHPPADTRPAPTPPEICLGEAPVEKDGSFYIAVPPDEPVRFELLDAAGRVVRAQQSWIWSRSGEEHGCVGCHEDRALAPENRWPLALRRFDTPTRLDKAVSSRR